MKTYPYIILGGGMVAGYVAKEIVRTDRYKPGTMLIISADTDQPYERPPLSKGFLAGKKDLSKVFINPANHYTEKGIDVMLEARVAHIDTGKRTLVLSSGDEIGFGKLVVATGGRIRELKTEGSNLPGVHYLRSLQDSLSIRSSAEKARRVVTVGAGFISMEVASVMNQKGLETTMLYPSDRVWRQLFTPEMSEFFEAYYKKKGVKLQPNTRVKGFRGTDRVEAVLLESGEEVAADLVVLGIGIDPAVELARDAGIKVENGIIVNEFLETDMPGIFAAGDVANYFDVLFKKQRRTEHWDNAVSQGKYIANALLGERKPFVHVPYFFSDEFDLSFEFWGDAEKADQVIFRGSVNEGQFSAWWLREGTVTAAFVMNRPDEEREIAPIWIETGKQVDRLQIENLKVDLNRL